MANGNLFENKLFLQYLAGAGGDIAAGEPIGKNVNQITQQNIAAQNKAKLNQTYMKMLKDILAGGGKVNLDKDKTKIDMPSAMLGGTGSELNVLGGISGNTELAQEGSALPGGSGVDWASILNPSSSPAISGADLAGLTPQDISQALSDAVGVETLKGKRVSDLADMIYREEVDRPYKQALTEKARREGSLDEIFPVEVPNVGKVTQRQWNALPTKDKEYALFVNTSKKLGDEDILSKSEFENLEPSEREQFLRAAMKDPELMDAATELARAGRDVINIGERTGLVADVKAKKYFTDPKGLAQDVDKHVTSEEVQSQLFQFAADPRQREIETIRAKERFITNKIIASGGTIVEQKLDGRTFVYTVKWPDGETTEVRYAN